MFATDIPFKQVEEKVAEMPVTDRPGRQQPTAQASDIGKAVVRGVLKAAWPLYSVRARLWSRFRRESG
jgi:hypothetical protein